MSVWVGVVKPTRSDVEERGKAAFEYMASAQLQCQAARDGEVLDHVTHEWWEDGSLRFSASGRPCCGVRTEDS